MLQKEKGMVRSVDVARHMGVSKPSVCHAVATLKEGGFLTMDGDFFLRLTDVGREVAEQTYEKTLLLYPLVDGGRCRSKDSRTGRLPHGAYDQREQFSASEAEYGQKEIAAGGEAGDRDGRAAIREFAY